MSNAGVNGGPSFVDFLMTSPLPVPYTKRHTTISDQIKLLEKRGMSIGDKRIAAFWLSRVGYYRLSGYWYELREQDNSTLKPHRKDNFKPGSNFSDVVNLYLFDENLRLLMLKAFSPIEVALRARTMHVLAKINDKAYLDTTFFETRFTQPLQNNTNSLYDNWLEKIKSSVERSKNETFLDHFFTKYCHPTDPEWWKTLPLWMMVDCWDFGVLSKCCSGLKMPWCAKIASAFGPIPGYILQSWIYTLNNARNFAAHHRRIWNRSWNVPSPHMPALNEMGGYFVHITAIHKTKSPIQKSNYMLLAIIKYFLIWTVKDSGQSWALEIKGLLDNFPSAFGGAKKLGFPVNWEKEPLWNL